MRTTLTLEADAFASAQAYAQARAMKLGAAISELIRQARNPGAQAVSPVLRPSAHMDGLWELHPLTPQPSLSVEQSLRLSADAEQYEDDRSLAFAMGAPLSATRP
jgi:hypothetical protein